MQRLLPPEESSRRARAAISYSGLEHSELEGSTGIPVGTLRRITSRTSPRRTSLEELWAIADACGVPRSFMEAGFEEGGPAPAERLEAVEHRLQTVSGLVQDLDERSRSTEDQLDAVAVLLPLMLERLGALDGQEADQRVVEALARAHGKTAQGGRRG